MAKEIELLDRIDKMNKVVERYLKGDNPTAIAKQTGMRRADVLGYIEEYKEIARNDEEVKGRAREALRSADEHINMIIARSWETVEQADKADDIRTKAGILKNLADIEGKRVEMLQKAGMYDDAALGDELADMEQKQEMLIKILREVTADCEHCKYEVAKRLSRITDKAEPIIIAGEVN
jgi:hypothetical protein